MNERHLGRGAKTEVLCVRLTAHEKDILVRRYGTASRALRVLVASVVTREEERARQDS